MDQVSSLNVSLNIDSSTDSSISISSSYGITESTSNELANGNLSSSSYLSYSPYYPSSSSVNPLLQNEFVEDVESEKEGLLQQYTQNRALDTPSLVTLAIVYTVLILIGAIGNGLVCLAVARQPKMRTSRNLFIINLAISDLLLCFFTIPFSLIEISTKIWPFGIAMCKLVSALEATSIYVSTLSITAIALDRYQVILSSMKPDKSPTIFVPHIVKLLAIWLIGALLALPLFLFRTVESHRTGIREIDPINFCIENWPIDHGRGYYSVFSLLIQYVLPITIVTVVYTRLCIKLRSRTLRRTSTTQLPRVRTRLQARARRTNLLLISIALIFCISWLPLNVLNIVADLYFPFQSDRSFRITFAICHMAGMSSSCSNPFLYGWLNQNFRNEFEQIFSCLRLYLFGNRLCNVQSNHHHTNSNHSQHHRPRTNNEPNSNNHNRIIHFQSKNSECTITDYHSPTRDELNASNKNKNKNKNNNNNNKKTNKTNGNNHILITVAEPSDQSDGKVNVNLMEPNTTQIYLSTTNGNEETSIAKEMEPKPILVVTSSSTSTQSTCKLTQTVTSTTRFSNSRFNRALTDSRKRRRKTKKPINVATGGGSNSGSDGAEDQNRFLFNDLFNEPLNR